MLNIPMLRMKTLLDLARNSDENINPPKLDYVMEENFNNLLRNFPESNPPSKWRRFGAALYGLGYDDPLKAQEEFINAPRQSQLQDWKTKAPFIQQAADNERQLNLGLLADYNRKMSDRNAKRRIDETARHNRESETIAAGRLEDQRQRTLLQQNKQNYQYFIDDNGMVVGVNRANPSDVRETHIHSNKLSDADKLDLQLGSAKELEAIRQRNRMLLENKRTENDITVKQTPSASASGAGTTPSQKKNERDLRASELISKDPEAARYIKIDRGTGKFIQTVMPTWRGDAKKKQEIDDYIFGTVKDVKFGDAPKPSETPKEADANTPPGPGYVKVQAPDGKLGWMLETELAKFPTYKRVK